MRARLSAAPVARLATVGERGPHIVPVTFALAPGLLYTAIDDKPKTGKPLQRLLNIAADPRVALIVDHYEEDWRRLWWVRVDGTAAVLGSDAEREAALDLLAAKYAQYRAARPRGPVIAVTPSRWAAWEGSADPG